MSEELLRQMRELVWANPNLFYTVTYTTTTTDSIPWPPDTKTYSQGFEDGWNANDAAAGRVVRDS